MTNLKKETRGSHLVEDEWVAHSHHKKWNPWDDEDGGDDDVDIGYDDEDCGDDDEDCGDDDEGGADEDVDSGYDDDDGFCSNRSFLRYNALIVNSHPDPGTGHLLSPMPQCAAGSQRCCYCDCSHTWL